MVANCQPLMSYISGFGFMWFVFGVRYGAAPLRLIYFGGYKASDFAKEIFGIK